MTAVTLGPLYSHVGVLVRYDLALVGHIDVLALHVRALDVLRVDVPDHRLVVVAPELLRTSNAFRQRDLIIGFPNLVIVVDLHPGLPPVA